MHSLPDSKGLRRRRAKAPQRPTLVRRTANARFRPPERPGSSVLTVQRQRSFLFDGRAGEQMNGPSRIPGLLVSVRSVDEALAALEGGADLIDAKEPSRGSLGQADLDVLEAIVSKVGRRTPVS